MTTYKHLTGAWLEIWNALGGDTEMLIVEDILAESHTAPHDLQNPVSDEAVEIAKEIMDHAGHHVELSDNWQGK